MYYVYMGNVLLPLAPKKFQLKVKNQNKTMTLIDGTEINFLKEAGLTELEFEVLLPAVQYSFAKYDGGFVPPNYFTDHFEKLKTEKKPFQFILGRQMPDGKILYNTNMTVSLESYTATESADEGFDTVVSIKLKQFKAYGTKTLQVNGNNASVKEEREQVNSPAPKQETTYTVKANDTLWSVAKSLYGDGSLYSAIAAVNTETIDDPNAIKAGQILKIPSKSQATQSIPTISKGASSTPKSMVTIDFNKG